MPFIRHHDLWFQNGYAYRECKLPLDKQGMVLVRGLNLDDGGFLGAGKTSPFEVFSLVQTGRVGKHRKGERMLADDVVNLSVGSGFEAHLRFDVDDHPYEIIQCRAHPKYGNMYRVIDLDSGRNILPSKYRNRPQNWTMEKLLQVEDTSFFNLFYLAQDFSNAMLNGTDGDRQQSITKMYGLSVYDKLKEMCQTRISALSTTVHDIDRLTEELKEVNAELRGFAKDTDELESELAVKKAELQEIQHKHDSAMDKAERLQAKLEPLERRSRLIKEVKSLWTGAKLPGDDPRSITHEYVDGLRTSIDENEDVISNTKSALRLFDQRSIIEERLKSLPDCDPDKAQLELDEVREQLRRLHNKELPKAEQRAELVADLRQLGKPVRDSDVVQDELDAVRDRSREIEQKINELKNALTNEVCPTCGRPFEEDADYDADELQKKVKAAQKKLGAEQTKKHELLAELKNAREYEETKSKLDAIGTTASTADVQKEINRYSREEKRLVAALESRQLRETLEKQLNDLPDESKDTLKKRLEKAQARIKKYKRQYDSARQIRDKLDTIETLPKGKAAKLRGKIISAKKTIRESMTKLARLSDEKSDLQTEFDRVKALTKRKAKIEKGLDKTKKAKTDLTCLRALEQVFGSKGLKRDRFMAILHDATTQTVPYYTNLLWPKRNAEIVLAETSNAVKFELERDGLLTSSRLLSGGERNKAGMALLFGLRDLKEKYTGVSTNVLVVDEPFGNLDAYGTDQLLNVLATQKERFGSVFVIGNQRDVLTNEIWDQVWWAVRENGEATLYQDGLPGRYHEILAAYEEQAG